MFVLSVLAGAFVSFGAIFATTVSAGSVDHRPMAIVRLPHRAWCSRTGLIMVIIGGAELVYRQQH